MQKANTEPPDDKECDMASIENRLLGCAGLHNFPFLSLYTWLVILLSSEMYLKLGTYKENHRTSPLAMVTCDTEASWLESGRLIDKNL